jgi:outer membrane lipoprotein SlyB
MKTIIAIIAAFLIVGTIDTASAADDGSTVSASQVKTLNHVMKGYIITVSDATIEAKSSTEATGAAAGASIGSVAASSLGGGGRGSIVSSIAGAVIGGIVGKVGGSMFGKQDAQDLVIQLVDKDGANAEIIAVTQAIDAKGKFVDGEPVLVLYKGDIARVIRNPAAKMAATGN